MQTALLHLYSLFSLFYFLMSYILIGNYLFRHRTKINKGLVSLQDAIFLIYSKAIFLFLSDSWRKQFI